MTKIVFLILLVFSFSTFSDDSFFYLGASYDFHELKSSNNIWDGLDTTTTSFHAGRRYNRYFATELSYSSYVYDEGPSSSVPEITGSNFDVTEFSIAARLFRKNLTISLGYSYLDVTRDLTIAEGSSLNESFYSYDRTFHAIQATIGYQIFILKSIELYVEAEASSNEQFHKFGANVGFRFYPGGLF